MKPAALVDSLLSWYDGAARDLPWRRTRDPYAIWVSEVMLQQTRVDTVIPYYQRFLREFPSVRALAAAPLERVLSSWSGLGYYRRARQLSLAAAEVVDHYGGELPRSAAELRELHGIGEYTAGAIASIAWGERAALCDGNVARVLARLYAIDDDMRSTRGKARAWAIARELVPAGEPGKFNQALMELGATICTPRAPACHRCPLAGQCRARKAGRQDELPRMAKKKPPRLERMMAVVASRGDEVLLGQRRADERFGGLWEPPLVPAGAPRESLTNCGIPVSAKLAPSGQVSHVLSHRRLEIEVSSATATKRWRLPEARAPYQELAWRAPQSAPLSTLAKKLLRAAGVLAAIAIFFAADAHAAEKTVPASEPAKAQPAKTEAPKSEAEADESALDPKELELYQRLSKPRGFYSRIFTSASFGRGFRFNNPFRLRTELGSNASSVSLTAPFFDLGLGVGFGNPNGLQHGPNFHASFALAGVSQQAVAISYMLLHRGGSPLMVYGRGGVSILTAPDANVGGELAAGLAGFFTGALGATAELVGDLYYGAGTFDKKLTAIPVLSFQAGLIVDLEVLP